MKEKIILIGGGGHCKACIDVIEAENKFSIAGIVDVKEKLHQKVLGYEIIGCDEDLPILINKYKNCLIAVGQINSLSWRREIFDRLNKSMAKFPVVVSPYAYISRHAFIGEGTIVMHNACVNAGVVIGKNCIINTGALIEHDVRIAEHCHISTQCVINGDCRIGEKSFIGSNSVIINKVNIADETIIGANSVVIDTLNTKGTYVGNPVRRIS